jgi:hypothetical protein
MLSDSCIQFYLKNNNSKKKTFFFLCPTPFFFQSVALFPFIFHPSYLPSVFIQYFSPFLSLPLFHFTTSIPHVLNGLSRLIALSALSFLSFCPIPFFSLLVPTSKSRPHFPFFCTLSPQELRNSLYHTPLILPVVSGFIFSLLSCLSVSLSVSLSSTFIHLPLALNLSTSSPVYPFLW